MIPSFPMLLPLMQERENALRAEAAREPRSAVPQPRLAMQIAGLLRTAANRLDPQYAAHASQAGLVSGKDRSTSLPALRVRYDPCLGRVVYETDALGRAK